MPKKIYVGVVGQIACGKGVLVDYLVKKHGFISFSLSTIVHQELKKRGIKDFNRKTLQDVGDDLRKKYGSAVLAKRALWQIKNIKKNHSGGREEKNPDSSQSRGMFEASTGGNESETGPAKQTPLRIIIEGIRNTAEVEYLKKKPNFILIGVKAKRILRFKRLLKRQKPWDPKTYNDFLKVDRRDLGAGQDRSGQQVGKCLAYCDYVLTNNKDPVDFHRKVEKLIEKIFKLNDDNQTD
ncbi:MAG: hypothetical protein QHH09_04815 [Microgenomates group bacterium]|nr:hypothetical protein [Microgenomates group bacterium]